MAAIGETGREAHVTGIGVVIVLSVSEHKTFLIWTSTFLALNLAFFTTLLLGNKLIFPLLLLGLGTLLTLFTKPKWLLYLFMLFFVFGEVSFGEFFVQMSFSNFFTLAAIGIIFIYGLINRHRFLSFIKSQNVRLFWRCFLLLLAWEAVSAVLNHAYRPLTTGISHLVSVVFAFLMMRNRKVLSQSFMLGMAGVGILSTLTVLRGLNLSPIGYQAPISWGSAPWESYIPRSIGLPNMQGGLHSIYILAFLPLAFLLAANMHRFKTGLPVRFFGACVALLGVLALLFASYRSGWLGLLVSLYCLAWIQYRTALVNPSRKIMFVLLVVGLVGLILSQYASSIYSDLYNLIFNIRSQGVSARVIQYEFVMERMFSPSIHLVFGYGFEDFGKSFTAYISSGSFNNPELYPWLHNYFLVQLYAIGWPGLIIFGILIFAVLRRLFQQTQSKDPFVKLFSSAILSSLCGVLVVLAFTAETSGLHIIWILMSCSFLLESDNQGSASTWSSSSPHTSNTQPIMEATSM
ncbi:MAG TPA: O-antigen ligase family protein [Anaerolineales bacterium]|nr:O-antigen ligase family protein [Anaerolineales bacterium]HLO32261.1 O-antigen ligase family protein [Anaerolineales bacterium]